MWKLALVISLLSKCLFVEDSSITVLILDDCQKWVKRRVSVNPDHFGYIIKHKGEVGIGTISHSWMYKRDSLGIIDQTFADILKAKPIFSSELSIENWRELDNDPKRRIFVLQSEDYCSSKRFVYNWQFTLYEVKIYVDATGNDLLPPINTMDTLRMKRDN